MVDIGRDTTMTRTPIRMTDRDGWEVRRSSALARSTVE